MWLHNSVTFWSHVESSGVKRSQLTSWSLESVVSPLVFYQRNRRFIYHRWREQTIVKKGENHTSESPLIDEENRKKILTRVRVWFWVRVCIIPTYVVAGRRWWTTHCLNVVLAKKQNKTPIHDNKIIRTVELLLLSFLARWNDLLLSCDHLLRVLDNWSDHHCIPVPLPQFHCTLWSPSKVSSFSHSASLWLPHLWLLLYNTQLQKAFSLHAGALSHSDTYHLNRHMVGCRCHEILIPLCYPDEVFYPGEKVSAQPEFSIWTLRQTLREES